jgi:hypothetical protein
MPVGRRGFVVQGARTGEKVDSARAGFLSSESIQTLCESGQYISSCIVSAVLTRWVVTGDEEAGGRSGHHDVPHVRRPGTRAVVIAGVFVDLDS